MELKVGDVIGVAGNHWDGFNKGRNHRQVRFIMKLLVLVFSYFRTNKVGLYPEYKTRERLRVVNFPTYEHVKI